MVITDFDVVGLTVFEHKANSPMVVYRYRVLAHSVSPQGMQPIAWRYTEVAKHNGCIYLFEFPKRPLHDFRRETTCGASDVHLLGPFIGKRLDHISQCNASRDACQVGDLRIARLTDGS